MKKKIHYFIVLTVLFQNMTAISPTRKYLSANFTAVSSLSVQSHALGLRQILAFLLCQSTEIRLYIKVTKFVLVIL